MEETPLNEIEKHELPECRGVKTNLWIRGSRNSVGDPREGFADRRAV